MKSLITCTSAILIAACGTAAPEPPSATTTVTKDPATSAVEARFTNSIWPAVAGCTSPCEAPSKDLEQLDAVTESNIPNGGYWKLRKAVTELGQPGSENRKLQNLHVDKLGTLADQPDTPTATLSVCYTYTLAQQEHTSEASVLLTNGVGPSAVADANSWYLRAITNDHVVPGCSAPPTKG